MLSHLAGTLPIYGLTVLSLAPSVAADYHVNNANRTVSYAPLGIWQDFSFTTRNLSLVLSDGTVTVVDSSKCWDRNYSLAACTANNNCTITFPFTGSGVTVYVVHAGFQGIAASLTIDDGQSVTTTLPPPTPPSYQTPGVTLFDLQSLPSTDHTATINLLDWGDGTTSLYFDHAHIRERSVDVSASSSSFFSSSSLSSTTSATVVVLQSSTIASSMFPTVSSTAVSSSQTSGATSAVFNAGSSVNLSAVVGGACGGLAALIAIVTAIIFFKKRRSRHVKLAESRKPDPFPDQIAPSSAPPLTDEKTRMRLAARNAMVYQSRRLSVGESSDFHILSTAGNAGRAPGGEARPSAVNPFLDDDFVIDCRREDGSLRSHGSVARDTPPPTLPDSSAPPGYQTWETGGL